VDPEVMDQDESSLSAIRGDGEVGGTIPAATAPPKMVPSSDETLGPVRVINKETKNDSRNISSKRIHYITSPALEHNPKIQQRRILSPRDHEYLIDSSRVQGEH
jgi:hypothetical protein